MTNPTEMVERLLREIERLTLEKHPGRVLLRVKELRALITSLQRELDARDAQIEKLQAGNRKRLLRRGRCPACKCGLCRPTLNATTHGEVK
jgi:hypothetical protein